MIKKTFVAAVYLRVSTKKQADTGTAISGQRKAIVDFLAREKIQAYKFYVDEGLSGTNTKRPALQRLLSDAEQPDAPFNMVIFWDVSRLDRSLRNWVNHIYSLRDLGISIRTVDANLNLDDPTHELVALLSGYQAEQFSITLSKNTRRGMNETIRQGFYTYGKPPFGYDIKKVAYSGTMKNKLILNEDEAKLVEKMFALTVTNDLGAKKIAASLNGQGYRHRNGKQFNFKTILKILRNEVYTGSLIGDKTRFLNGRRVENEPENRVVHPNAHHAIIDKRTYKKAQERIDGRHNGKYNSRTANSQFLFTGIAFCGICGLPMFSTHGRAKNKSTHFYYACKGRITQKSCSLRNFRQPMLDALLLTVIETEILAKTNLESVVKKVNMAMGKRTQLMTEQVTAMSKEIGVLKQKMERITNLLITHNDSDADVLLPKLNELDREKVALEIQQRSINDSRFQPVVVRNLDQLLGNLKLLLTSVDLPKRKAFVSAFISKVEIFEDKAVLHYKNPLDPARNRFIAPFAEALTTMPKKSLELSKGGVHLWVSYASPRGIEPLLRE